MIFVLIYPSFKMVVDNRLRVTLKIFHFTLAYCVLQCAGTPYDRLFDAPPGTKVGRMTVIDISQHSTKFLTEMRTQVIVDVGYDMIYRLELEEPDIGNKTFDEARKAIGETAERKAEAVNELIRKLDGITDLRTPTNNNAWLVRFLRGRDYDVSLAIDLIKKYYKFKEEHKEVYDGLIPSKEKDIFAKDIVMGLVPRDEWGRRILIARGGQWDGSYKQTIKVCRMIVLLLEIGAYEPASQLAGAQIILDMKGMGIKQYKSVTVSALNTIIKWVKNCVPLKLQGIHVVNKPWWFYLAEKTILPFIIGDIKDIFYIHKDFDSLHKKVSVEALPDIYGGHYKMYESTEDEWEVFLKYLDKEYKELTSYGFRRPKNVQSSVKSMTNVSQYKYERPLNMMETDISHSRLVLVS